MCEFCEEPFKAFAVRKDEIYTETLRVKHMMAHKPFRPKSYWILEAYVASGTIYGTIFYCPMCGRKLTEEK